ncbi:delta and Notch-like epidermal growth factor-related receptor [Branchiostoma floridae]|uniref:Delta and Notch-like epidermal growth factor-related receptor n=1 Tax=Branchiostoma floridae TaxID=7739 RepID=A0A9J7MPJ9_BRAFL|nr:delta and Notch-like epidermal growth factor-related receptor [Branchiostoma floridae]
MGACYQFSLHAVSYGDASQSCGAGGGYLADVRKAEQQHLIGNASTTGSDVSLWIGIKVPPVTLTYSDGSSVSDELEWASSQPASPCDLCVLLDSSSNYQAITTPCGEQHNYVCQAEPKPCGQDICHNGGNCSSCFDGSYNFCACLDGFDGKFCEINIDECASSPCQNGGSCTDGVDSFSCECAIGYSGDFCEADIDWCTQGQGYCPFGWICEDMVTHFICHATSNNLKSLYQCDSDTCPNGMTCIAEGPGSFSCRAG